jgi:hypothetical protein
MCDKLPQAERQDATCLLHLDEAGFCGSPPVQRHWSARGLPHEIESSTQCRRGMLGTLDYGTNMLIHATRASDFIDDLLATNDERPNVILLDRADVHQSIDDATRDRRLIDHKAVLFYLPANGPELDKIEIVRPQLKYRW